MEYGFNEDKSKAEFSSDIVTVIDSQSLASNDSATITSLLAGFGITSDKLSEYHIISVEQGVMYDGAPYIFAQGSIHTASGEFPKAVLTDTGNTPTLNTSIFNSFPTTLTFYVHVILMRIPSVS